jgi:hypothetical protein
MLPPVFFRQLDGNVVTEGRRPLSDIHNNITHRSSDYAHEFALLGRGGDLEMEAAQSSGQPRYRAVFLHELDGSEDGIQAVGAIGLGQQSTLIAVL